MTQTDYRLVATQFSYYSAKVRACLQYKRLPYEEIGCNYDTIFNHVLPATGQAKFPVVFCPDGAVLSDSCDIVKELEKRHPERPVVPEDMVLALIAVLLETVADEFLAAPFIYYRWVPEDTRAWALDLFHLLVTEGLDDPADRDRAGEVSQLVAAGIQERVQKIGQDRPDVQRESRRLTQAVCDALERHLSQVPFILGERPSMADLALMNGFFGHLYMDPCEASQYIRRHCTRLSLWLTRMHAAAGESDRGELFATDSLNELLAALAGPFQPFAQAVLEGVDEGVRGLAAGTELPASFGQRQVRLNETSFTVGASPYVAWKLQRLRDRYAQLSDNERERADTLLDACGFLSVCSRPLTWRLEKAGSAMQLSENG